MRAGVTLEEEVIKVFGRALVLEALGKVLSAVPGDSTEENQGIVDWSPPTWYDAH